MKKNVLGVAVALGGSLALVTAWSASAQVRPGGPVVGGPVGVNPGGGNPGGGNPGGGNPGGGNPGGGGNNPTPAPQLGGPIAGLDTATLAVFNAGRGEFTRQNGIQDGLGPVFNDRSCVGCHAAGGVGGAGGSGADLGRTQVLRIGRLLNGGFDPLEAEGGAQLQRRSIKELDPACPLVGERVPASATIVSVRATPAIFGDGLIEAIPDSLILAKSDPNDTNRDGISGRPNWLFNPETGRTELGRFGWKGLVPTLHLFTAGAYQGELGITNPTFPTENLPQGRTIPVGWDRVADPEEGGGRVELASQFQRYLAPPPSRALTAAGVRGQSLFTSVGCAACHTPSLTTGGTDRFLSNRLATLYSDLLLHDMGDQLDDKTPMGVATGREWRTTPLWGLNAKRNWMHDGRANSLDQSIRLHGGESQGSTTRYQQLTPTDRDALLQFLGSL
jgi:CxxC motif-containing protein (DUF1111 family)